MSLPVANFYDDIFNSIIGNSPWEENFTNKIITSFRCEKTKSLLKDCKNICLNYVVQNLNSVHMLGMLHFSDGNLVLRTAMRMHYIFNRIDQLPPPPGCLSTINNFEVPIFKLFGYKDKDEFFKTCLSIRRINLPLDCTRIICSYLTPNVDNLMLVPDACNHNSDLTLAHIIRNYQVWHANDDTLCSTRLDRRLAIDSFLEYSKITLTGSYLGSYGGFSIYNTHGNCGSNVERLNPEIHKENQYESDSVSDSESDDNYYYIQNQNMNLILNLCMIVVMIILTIGVILILMIINKFINFNEIFIFYIKGIKIFISVFL